MTIRELTGMEYSSVTITHNVAEPMSDVLRALAGWLEQNDYEHGVLTSITTQCDPDDWELFQTTLIWS